MSVRIFNCIIDSMFGYVVINQPEMKFREFDEYRGFYCGICQVLKKKYGQLSRLTLNYDMTFLAILLTGLYEPQTDQYHTRCVVHPFKAQSCYQNPYIEYAADMTIILTYYKCLDDIQDEGKLTSKAELSILRKYYQKLRLQYQSKCEAIEAALKDNSSYEHAQESDIDLLSGATGRLLSEVYAYQNDVWENTLREIGYYLGKFIYLIDAYDDLDDDIKHKQFNLFTETSSDPDFEQKVDHLLEMMMAECSAAFETLPIFQYADILRNIIYSGVFTKLALIRKRKDDKKND